MAPNPAWENVAIPDLDARHGEPVDGGRVCGGEPSPADMVGGRGTRARRAIPTSAPEDVARHLGRHGRSPVVSKTKRPSARWRSPSSATEYSRQRRRGASRPVAASCSVRRSGLPWPMGRRPTWLHRRLPGSHHRVESHGRSGHGFLFPPPAPGSGSSLHAHCRRPVPTVGKWVYCGHDQG